MTARLVALAVGANDPPALARFWSHVLGWDRTLADDVVTLRPDDGDRFPLRFEPTDEPKLGRNRMHFELTSQSLSQQRRTVDLALSLGAQHLDVGQGPDADHVVLADPEGNEFCVIEPGNNFLAGCGFLGALSCDGTQQVGYFWSEALGWPLVWDQDQETAIRSPHGGPKITWGGPPLMAEVTRDRLHFDLAADGDQQAELDRLLRLGASRVDVGGEEHGRVVLSDPDGSRFCLLSSPSAASTQ